jgi:hypothetical protein
LRDCEPQRLRCLEVDHHLELGGPHDWKIARLQKQSLLTAQRI